MAREVFRHRRRFNPTLVRLRQMARLAASGIRILFQSHAGSIEARQENGRLQGNMEFQSHAGSIEAPP